MIENSPVPEKMRLKAIRFPSGETETAPLTFSRIFLGVPPRTGIL